MRNICLFCCELVVNEQCIACGRRPPDPKLEFFATPASAVRALLQREAFQGLTWEPACGIGPMADMIPGQVMKSDLGCYGFGEGGVDFLKTWGDVDNVVTNPPFSKVMDFKRHALEVANRKVAMLAQIGFMGHEIEAGTPLKAVYVFKPKAIKFVGCNIGWQLAWYVWERGYRGTIRVERVEPVFPKKRRS